MAVMLVPSDTYTELRGDHKVIAGENLIVGERGEIFRVTIVQSPYMGPLPTPTPKPKVNKPYYRKFSKSRY